MKENLFAKIPMNKRKGGSVVFGVNKLKCRGCGKTMKDTNGNRKYCDKCRNWSS